MRLIRLPGVHRPLSDTWMLAGCLPERLDGRGLSVLDLCAGTGAIAITAGEAGAHATAVDLSWRCVLACRLNARLNGTNLEVRRGDLFAAVAGRRFTVIVANPPYLPARTGRLSRHRAARSLNGGWRGRLLIDRICRDAPRHLEPGGSLLILHSSVNGVDETVERLRVSGLHAGVVFRHHGPLGPVMSSRAQMLERRGLLAAGSREEEIVVVEGRRPGHANPCSSAPLTVASRALSR